MSGIGSARHDENGKLIGGKVGDQLQTILNGNDLNGEVSMQNMYTHKLGWYILRPKNLDHADRIACAMVVACNNAKIGYNQNADRSKPIDVASATPINCDCSMLVRGCVYAGTGEDVGNFSTKNEVLVLTNSGLFEKRIDYINEAKTPIYIGDILVSRSKGHTAIVVTGKNRRDLIVTDYSTYYPKYKGSSTSIVTALKTVGEKDTSLKHRKEIANVNGINNYKGTASQNLTMVKMLKAGKLKMKV